MPVTTSYPGIYIEELPSNAHSVTAAPTSIAVFVGYTHPFKTLSFGTAVELFSFTDYEGAFGGLYASGQLQSHVAYAVNQFFLNGGSHAYVVGLPAKYLDANGSAVGPDHFTAGSGQIGNMVFTAREPTDLTPMTVTVDNVRLGTVSKKLDTADVTIVYGARVESYRGVTIDAGDAANFIGARLATSSLVTVSPPTGQTDFGITITLAGSGSKVAHGSPASLTFPDPPNFATTFHAADFTDVFMAESSLDKLHVFNLIVLPGVADNEIWSAALAFAERRRAFVILDPPVNDVATPDPTKAFRDIFEDVVTNQVVPPSPNGALYFPWLKAVDPLAGSPIELPPSGYVAGIFARTDTNRGVWKAPAGLETTLLGTTGVTDRGVMTDMGQGTLNPWGINCLRTFPAVGTVVFGARTLVTHNTAFAQWSYVPVRRMALFIEQSLYDSLTWAVFEPNAVPLWVALTTTVTDFMLSLFRQGAFAGTTPSQSFRVQCDASTTTQTDVDQGVVNIVVAFAPLKPAEFVVIKLAQLAGQAQT